MSAIFSQRKNVTRYKLMLLLRVFSSMQMNKNALSVQSSQVGYVLSMFLTSGSISASTFLEKKKSVLA